MARLEQQSFRVLPSTAPTITGRDATPAPSLAESSTADDTESIVTIRGPVTDEQNFKSSDQRQVFGYSFDQDLNTSRPYTRALQKHGAWSTTSSETHTMGWSCLSGLSLAEISHISVINLPFSPQELWNGHRYFETRINRSGLILSKHRSSLSSEATQAAPKLRHRLKTRVPVHSSQTSKILNPIKEDTAVPLAAKTVFVLGKFPYGSLENIAVNLALNYSHLSGGPDSGKTTVFNHLQILYGNGITEVERLTAFEFIIRNLVDIFIDAWPKTYDRDRQKTSNVRNHVTCYLLC